MKTRTINQSELDTLNISGGIALFLRNMGNNNYQYIEMLGINSEDKLRKYYQSPLPVIAPWSPQRVNRELSNFLR